MRAILGLAFMIALALGGPAQANAGCVESDGSGTFQYRYCDKGVAYERQHIGYGFGWGSWTRVHPNVQPPCRWLSLESMWMCSYQKRIHCKDGICR